jgi:3-dehydroquinate dehydratase/shikimate dehydrogenase
VICCSIVADSKDKAVEEMLSVSSRADIIEMRLDYIDGLTDEDILEIISKKPSPIIMTCRKQDEGGKFQGTEEARIGILLKCVEFGCDYVDIELSSGDDLIKNIISNKKDTKVIVSYHNFDIFPDDVEKVYAEIKNTNCDIVKIACMANSINDNLTIFRLIEKAKKEDVNIIGTCMGEKGEISRILSLAYGAYMTFGSLEKGKETAPGQISSEFLKRVYRADKIKLENLKIYGLVGNPVSESRGFIIHNLNFKEQDMNSVYLNFLVDDIKDFIDNYRNIFSGLSVTMPFKQDIIPYLDKVEDVTKNIGAVNTVNIEDGKLVGYNTDTFGAISAIKEKTDIEGKKVVMIGAGGAARAIGYGLTEGGANLVINNRTVEKGMKLASELNAEFTSLDEIGWNEVDILVNATSVGMMPDLNEMPLDGKYLHDLIVFDSVYNPLITKMLDIAEKNGCEIVSGIKMFVYQAAKQFEIWSGKKPDIDFMENKVLEYAVG